MMNKLFISSNNIIIIINHILLTLFFSPTTSIADCSLQTKTSLFQVILLL